MGNNVKLYGGVDTRNTPGLVPGAGHDVGGGGATPAFFPSCPD